jgi:hypothetical protein
MSTKSQLEAELFLAQLIDKGWRNWTEEEVVRVREIKRRYSALFQQKFGLWKQKNEMLTWPRTPVQQYIHPIVKCNGIEGKCCAECHKMEEQGRFGLQAEFSKDGDTVYLACCRKLDLLQHQGKISFTGRRVNMTWDKARKIRALYGKPIPGEFWASGAAKTYTYKALSEMFGVDTARIGEIVLNETWQE